MKTRFASLALLATSVVVSFAVTATANSADKWNGAKPMFAVIPHNAPGHYAPVKPAANLAQWSGSFKDRLNNTINYVMVGTDPHNTNTTTTVNVVLIPVKMIYGSANGNMTFNPKRDTYPGGQKVIANMLNSPVFNNIDYVQGGVDVGNTQYIDAYQRANFWQTNVQNESNYHVLLKITTTERPLKITVQSAQGKVITNPFGTIKVGTMDINAFDSQLNTYISGHSADIHPDVLPLFVTDNIYLTSGGCCIGGYHSARGGAPSGQTYAYTTLVTEAKSFSQDVSALTHEIGEWMDDPFTTNRVHCQDNGIMENGDPLVSLPNYGGYPYKLSGFTYNLQDLVFIGYFGSPDVSVNNYRDFQNAKPGDLCPGQ
jgi:hypothetical protein